MNREFMSLAKQYRHESINQPPDDWWWLARPSIHAGDAVYLLAQIQPNSFTSTLEGLRQWQIDALEVLPRLMQEDGTAGQERPLLQWFRWANAHPEIDLPLLKKRAGRILRAMEANTQTVDAPMSCETPYHAPELRIALEAWQAVSANPPSGKAVKKALEEWLDRHHPGLSKDARGRIAMVANWNKRGGATPAGK